MEAESYSYENGDVETSRKRPLEGGQEDRKSGRQSKRSNKGNKPSLKILIPNHMAGKLIGKGGSNINELETKYDASIQVSPNKEFYPGTDERIVSISADINEIISFSKNMIENVLVDKPSDAVRLHSGNFDFRIVISNIAVGLVIGKGGSIIKIIQDETHANINIAKQDDTRVPGERVLTIRGSLEQQSAACQQIIEKMSTEPMKMSNTNTKYGYINGGGGGGGSMYNNSMDMGYGQQPSLYQNYPNKPDIPRHTMDMNTTNGYGPSYYEQKSRVKTTHMTLMEIPNSLVGSIVGKQGQNINEITRSSGAKINFSGKEEFAPGTTDRILTIKGGKNEIHTAFILMDQKVAQVENEFNTPSNFPR